MYPRNQLRSLLGERRYAVVAEMVDGLKQVPGIEAIVLGGSFARRTAKADSDVDLGLYYSEKSPFKIEDIKRLAKKFNSGADCVVTDFYEWGPFVNGGAWINTNAGKIDWLYRNITQVDQVLKDASKGLFTWDYRQQPPFGFFSVMYLGDIVQNIVLYDPKGMYDRLAQSVRTYPEPLRQSIIREHLWSVEFSYERLKTFADRNEIYGALGCLTRIAAELTQVLFALNSVYFVTENEALQSIESFAKKPAGYAQRMTEILTGPFDKALPKLKAIIADVRTIVGEMYQPKFQL